MNLISGDLLLLGMALSSLFLPVCHPCINLVRATVIPRQMRSVVPRLAAADWLGLLGTLEHFATPMSQPRTVPFRL